MNYILAIDQGTTGSRAVVYNTHGENVTSSYREFPQYFPQPGWVEHDPEEIWDSVFMSIRDVVSQLPEDSILAIGITNQRETTVVWDRKTGKPVYNAIVWQCRRTTERCQELVETFGEQIREKTGLPPDPYFSATKLEWILRNVPGALRMARQGELLFGTIDSWLIWNLTGGKVHATDYTNASRSMLYNIDSLEWDSDLTKEFGMPNCILPHVVPSSGIVGYTAEIHGLPSGIPIAGVAGDQQAALFGQTCFQPGTIKNTYGTGSFLLMNVGKKRIRSKTGLIETLACGPRGEPTYALEGAIFVSGAAIQWLRDGLGIIPSATESEPMATSVESNEGVYFVPAFVGLGAPYWDPNARGAIYGLTRGTTANHIVRAAIEAMCYQTKDVLDAMQKESGLSIPALKVDGGASVNNFLCQFQADILGIDVIRPKTTETTSLGAAFLAGLAVGYWDNTEDIQRKWQIDRKFTPIMPAEQANKLHNGWRQAVWNTLSDCRRQRCVMRSWATCSSIDPPS